MKPIEIKAGRKYRGPSRRTRLIEHVTKAGNVLFPDKRCKTTMGSRIMTLENFASWAREEVL